MSLTSLVDNSSQDTIVTTSLLRELAHRSGFTILPDEEDAYLLALKSARAIALEVDNLPDFIDERLSPIPTKGGSREYCRPRSDMNSINAWYNLMDLRAAKPNSQLLQGRSVALKDTIAVGGIPQALGTSHQLMSKTGDYPISQIDATVVRRILEAGATIKGTSVCENYSLSPMSYTAVFGPVHNPWLRGYNSGGSSSGSAALVALALARKAGVFGLEHAGPEVNIAIGGDQAGSIRLPAAYCGIYGFKPTHGLVPYTGVAGLHPMIDHVGPLGQSVDDIAICLSAIAGYDGLDGRMGPESPLREDVTQYGTQLDQFTAELRKSPGKTSTKRPLRVGLITESFIMTGMSQEVAEIVKTAATKHFTAMGAEVSHVSIPLHSYGAAIWTAATRNQMASHAFGGRSSDILTHNMPHLLPRWPADQEMYNLLTYHNPAVVNVILGETLLTDSRYLPASAQGKAHRHVFQLRAAYDEALQNFDVLVTPTAPNVAPPLPDMTRRADGATAVLDKLRLAAGVINNTAPFNITGHPALSVPCGWGLAVDKVHSLPVGMQIVGQRFDDLSVLKAAKIFELGGGGLGHWPGP